MPAASTSACPRPRLQRGMGIAISVIAVATIVVSLIQTPFSAWDAMGSAMAGLLLFLAFMGIYTARTGNYFSGNRDPKIATIAWALSLIGLTMVAALTAVVDGDRWTVSDTNTIGIWLIVTVYGIVEIIQLRTPPPTPAPRRSKKR